MMKLKDSKCVPCEDGADPLDRNQISEYKKEIKEDWDILDNKKLSKEYSFDNFSQGVAFANDVAGIAEAENHHPDICIYFKKVEINLSTHKIGGLSVNDFIVAAKIDDLG